MLERLETALQTLGAWLIHTDVGLAVLVAVGASIALSHIFALLANRLNGREILLHLLLDGLILSVAFLLSSAVSMLLLRLFASSPVPPSDYLNGVAPCLLPAMLYVLTAAPYVGELLALVIWVVVHLNVLVFLHVRFALPYGEALLLASPGYGLALTLVWLLFQRSWRASYASLASHLRDQL